MGNNITCSTNCKYRTAATLYTLEAWGFFQIYNCKYHAYKQYQIMTNNNNNNNNNQ